jgi:hypothetical protein
MAVAFAVVTCVGIPASNGAFADQTGAPPVIVQASRLPNALQQVTQSSAAGRVTGTAQDPQGDKMVVTLAVGAPSTVAAVANRAIQTCDQTLVAAESSPSRSIAVPVTLTIKITSSLSTAVEVDLGLYVVPADSQPVAPDTQLDTEPLWAGAYSSGPTCEAAVDGGGTVNWRNAEPNRSLSWLGWIIIPRAITPRDPTGLDTVQDLVLIIGPHFPDGPTIIPLHYSAAKSPALVRCSGDPFAAVDPKRVIANGCTKG